MLAETGRAGAEHLPGETKLEWQQELLQNFQQGSAGGWGRHCCHLTLLSLILAGRSHKGNIFNINQQILI